MRHARQDPPTNRSNLPSRRSGNSNRRGIRNQAQPRRFNRGPPTNRNQGNRGPPPRRFQGRGGPPGHFRGVCGPPAGTRTTAIDLTVCSICLGSLPNNTNDRITLNCGHTYCLACLRDSIAFGNSDRRFHCPTCNRRDCGIPRLVFALIHNTPDIFRLITAIAREHRTIEEERRRTRIQAIVLDADEDSDSDIVFDHARYAARPRPNRRDL